MSSVYPTYTTDQWRQEIPGFSRDILPFYIKIASELPDGAQVVEIGVACGRSITFLAERLLLFGKKANLWAIDPWVSGWETQNFWFDRFLKAFLVVALQPEREMIHPVRAPSLKAVNMFEDQSLDMVFIDGMHDVANVKADILAWRPKVKPGGLFAGHDYDQPGVKQAVDELVKGFEVEDTVWWTR
jgi:methyltransferase family protein